MEVDSLYRLLGRPGRFHIIIYILMCCNYFPVILNHLAMAIYGARSSYQCKLPEGNPTNESIPYAITNGKRVMDRCHVYENYTRETNRTISCPDGWSYELGPRESNIISEWDLVCDRAYLPSLATTIYFSGVMIGGIIFGSLSDRWGRKPFMLLTLYGHIFIGIGTAFANSYILFVLLRFAQGILMQGLQTCTYVLIMESFSREHRTVVGTVFEVFWGTGVIWLACVSWLIQDWRYIQLAITLPSCLAIVYIWLMPESVRWLVSKQKYKEAELILRKAAKFNGVSLPEDPLETRARAVSQIPSEKPQTEVNKYTLIDMFRTPQLRKRSMILFYIWFVMSVGYYGLSLSITSLAGNKYLNLLIGGVLELPAYCSCIYILNRFGRRRPLCVYLLTGGVFCILAGTVPTRKVGSVDLQWVSTGLAVVGRFGMAGCFSVMLLYTCELYPTVIRNVSMGSCAFWSRVGGMIAPQILFLGEHIFSSLPVIIFGCMALLGGLLSLALPETLNKQLPDTIEQAESIGRKVAASVEEMPNGTAGSAASVEEYLLQGPVKKETFI